MSLTDLTGDLPDAAQDKTILPGYVSQRPGGVCIDLARLQNAAGFETFINRLFTGGERFSGLDYALFLKLLYDADWLAAMQAKRAELKIAAEIVSFPAQRQALYRPVRVTESGKLAEYVFEPASIEVEYQQAVYAEPTRAQRLSGTENEAEIIEYVTKTRKEPTRLDFDEFVADMWLKGVKYGIDANAVRQAISGDKAVRMKVAAHLEPTEGRDAEIKEVCADLHRDNSPKVLLSGKADLRAFKNRFPQIKKGVRLLKKIPRALGRHGYAVTGEIIEPVIPKDLDLAALSSVGTLVEQEKDIEYIVAAQDGFLTIDTQTNKISITEKIENKAGISVKTTGDLMLGGAEFIEHGEVQEARVVKGKNMTFLSDVFGKVISDGGNIFISGNLAGGRAESLGGNIVLGKRASRAVIRARDGEVTVNYCESSVIVGKIVRIEHAVNCEIVADELYADVIEGCMIAAKAIKITTTDERRDRETLATVLIPDLSGFDRGIESFKKKIAEIQANVEAKMRENELLKADAEFAKYLALDERIRSGAIKLTDEQALAWQKLVEKNAKSANALKRLGAELNALDSALKESEEELVYTVHDRDAIEEGVSCVIDKVIGHTTVQTMKSINGIDVFNGMAGDGIRAMLQKVDGGKTRIFSGDAGAFDWAFKQPAAS